MTRHEVYSDVYDMVKNLYDQGKIDKDMLKILVMTPNVAVVSYITKEEYETITGEAWLSANE